MINVHAVWNYEGETIYRDYTHIDKAIYLTKDGRQIISDDDLLTHIFPLNVVIYFQGPDCNYVINPHNLISLEINKQR